MVIMSDVESFSLKLVCVILGLLAVGFLFAFLRETAKEPEIVYRNPDTVFVTDTVIVHDTIWWRKPEKAVEATEQITSEDSVQC